MFHENISCDPSLEPSRRDGSKEGSQHMFHENIFCDPSLEPSRRDGSKEGSQHMFSWIIKKYYL